MATGQREGRIERAIREHLAAHPDEAFTTDELCEVCYPGLRSVGYIGDPMLIARKHRVAVLRAAKKVLASDPDWNSASTHGRENMRFFWNAASVPGTAMGFIISLGRARDRIRPVALLRAWLKAAKIKSGPIFLRVNKSDRTQDQLDGGSVGLIVKRYARLAGFDVDALGGHSLRVGFTTSAAASSATAAMMANVTRHTDMNVLFGYIRTANAIADYPAAILR
jgi:hypothetical protein